MLVAAVLRPEQGEDGQLEVVRLAPQQVDDTVELLVGEAQLAVELLFRDGAQEVSLALPSAQHGDTAGIPVRARFLKPGRCRGRETLSAQPGERSSHRAGCRPAPQGGVDNVAG
jgi:hypothetical protein